MKKILLILCLFPILVFSQKSYKIPADSTILNNIGSGKNELVIRNATSNITGGVLTNLGNGVTAFVLGGGSARVVDTIYKNSAKDSIVFTISGIRYAVKDSFNLNTDSQTLSISNDTLTISGGNSVVLPVYVQADSSTINSYDVLNSQNTPPVSPSTGDVYLVGNVPTGAWVGQAKDIAEWNGSAWVFTDGVQGDFLYNATNALTYIFRSGNWVQTTGIPALNNGNTISSGLKIGTNNSRSLTFETNNVNRGRFDSVGRFYVYDTSLRKANKYLQIDSITGRLIASEVSGSGGGGSFTKSKAEIDALITANELVAGALYEITGVHPTLYDDGTTSGTTIYLRAISGNQLEVQGMGKFFNPKYNKSVDGFGIWDNKMYGTLSNVVGVFDYLNKELVTADNSATGLILADGMIQWLSGDWSAALSITGSVSGATADVTGFVTPSYSIANKVIWGGYSWTNVNGNVGTSTDVLNLDSEWSKNPYDTTNYNVAYDVIEYDYANDFIVRRYNKEANIDVKCSKAQYDFFVGINGLSFHAISVQQWGNNYDLLTYKGQFNIICNGGYNESVNFSGSGQYYLTFESGSYQGNITFGNNSYQGYLTFGSGSSQSNLTFGSGSGQTNLTFGNNSYQANLTFGSGSGQTNLTFGNNSYQANLTFGSGSYQSNLTFGNNSYQANLTFGSGSGQSNLTFGNNSYQANLTFGSGLYQGDITFGSGSQLDYNSQVISSNMQYITFNTKNVTVPDLSAATLIFDGNVKEVYQRPDGALKIRYYDNSDALVIADIAD